MDGMTVHAFFATGFNEMVSWVAGVGDSGGAFGTDWSLTVDGDTFNTEWNFTNDTRLGLVGLLLDGVPGLTLFDRTFGNVFGTPGSALGLDFAESPTTPGTATYSQQVTVIVPPPVGDLWHVLRVDFDDPILGDWSFFQDTDNDSRRPPPVAEPSTLALLGMVLALTGISRRRPVATRTHRARRSQGLGVRISAAGSGIRITASRPDPFSDNS